MPLSSAAVEVWLPTETLIDRFAFWLRSGFRRRLGMAPVANWTEEKISVAGTELAMIKGGTGKPLLIFHDELGYPGCMTCRELPGISSCAEAPTNQRRIWTVNVD